MIQSKMGTHGIGHTRFSTESLVDRYHAHPFQSYIIPDITVVHNGQITNYWKIRVPLAVKPYIRNQQRHRMYSALHSR